MTDYRINPVKQPDTTKRKGGIAAPVRPYCMKESSYNKPHYRAGGQNQDYENQPFGSMPRCCSSLRIIRFIQAETEASPSCANACFIPASNSGSTRNAICLLPFPLILMVDIWLTPNYLKMVIKCMTSAYQKATPRSAVTHAGRLTTNNSESIEVAMKEHITHTQGRDFFTHKPDYGIFTSSGLCCKAGYAASCPSVKSNLIALYGNTILPWSSWSITPAFSSACTSRCTPRKSRPIRRASSRIETAPVPVMALMICSRPAPSMTLVSDSTSGNVRENGTSTACPDIAATKAFCVSSYDSLADITRTTSVLITLPPDYFHIVVKLADKVIQPGERDGKLNAADVLMVTLSGFVVVAHNTYILNDISKAVFVVVLASPDRWINHPYRDTGESVLVREVVTFFNEQISRHVLPPFTDDNYSINISVMSKMSSKALDRLNCWRYSDPAPYKTGVGRGNPKQQVATQTPQASFFVSCPRASISGGQTRDVSMVALAGLPQGRPVPTCAGISTPVNVTALFERGNSGGDSIHMQVEAAVMATTPTQSHPVSARHNHVNKPLFVWRFFSCQQSTYHTVTATSELEARAQLPDAPSLFAARIRTEEVRHA